MDTAYYKKTCRWRGIFTLLRCADGGKPLKSLWPYCPGIERWTWRSRAKHSFRRTFEDDWFLIILRNVGSVDSNMTLNN